MFFLFGTSYSKYAYISNPYLYFRHFVTKINIRLSLIVPLCFSSQPRTSSIMCISDDADNDQPAEDLC